MADWVTISSLATASGTLVLAVATFGSVRSANRAARVAEQALLAGQRPLLVSSRFDDAAQEEFTGAHAAVQERRYMTVYILYGDQEGGQRVISRFGLNPRDDGAWIATIARHWHLDRPDPR